MATLVRRRTMSAIWLQMHGLPANVAALLAVTAVTMCVACGGASLSTAERSRAGHAEQVILGYAVDGDDYAGVLRSVDTLIALYRSKPGATLGGHPLRQELRDMASSLDATDPALARRLDRETGS